MARKTNAVLVSTKLAEAQRRIKELEQARAADLREYDREIADRQQKLDAAIDRATTAEATIKRRDNTIESLKTELMGLTVENATLHGYITRANESDPPSVLTDRIERRFGRGEDGLVAHTLERAATVSAADTYGRNATAWWNRH